MVAANKTDENELKIIVARIQAVKEVGFGEVRIIIQNGVVNRILVTKSELIEESAEKNKDKP